jgi:hypothetical protein
MTMIPCAEFPRLLPRSTSRGEVIIGLPLLQARNAASAVANAIHAAHAAHAVHAVHAVHAADPTRR